VCAMTTSDTALILERLYASVTPSMEDLESLLSLEAGPEAEKLFSFADKVRRDFCGEGILLRGIVEFSNICKNTCFYCGLNRNNASLQRYRMDDDEILRAVGGIASCGIKTVVLQSGEDDGLKTPWLSSLIRRIKSAFGIAVTLSVGERSKEDYAAWREAGADRYLLKIETTGRKLYQALHPGMSFEKRLQALDDLRGLGYQVGSGIIVGLKGQDTSSIARDIIFLSECDFDMIGIGPFISHQNTPLAGEKNCDAFLALKTLALTRIVVKNAHLPATTALGSLGQDFRIEGLQAGANVLMPNFTPAPYRRLYEIYPGKRCVDEPSGSCASCMESMASLIERRIDYSRGDTLKLTKGHPYVSDTGK